MEEAYAINKRLKEALDLQKRAAMKREKMNNKSEKIQNWLLQELHILESTVDAEYTLENLMQDRASLVSMLDKIRNSSDANEEKISELTDFIDLRNTQISDLQQKVVESDQENRKHSRWQQIQTMDDAKTALKILFKHTAENRRKLCAKEFEYNDLMEKLEEVRATETERCFSGQLASNENANRIIELKNEEIAKLKEELEEYKEKCQRLEPTVLSDSSDNIKKPKPKVTKRMSRVVTLVDENTFPLSDDSITEYDDTEKDPDWIHTPLYKRIKKLQNTTRNSTLDRTTVKRSSDGDIRCSCNTKCTTHICACFKNKAACINCSCNRNMCKNKYTNNFNRNLFVIKPLITLLSAEEQ